MGRLLCVGRGGQWDGWDGRVAVVERFALVIATGR